MCEPASQNDVQQMLDRQTDRLNNVIRDNSGQLHQQVEQIDQRLDQMQQEIQRLTALIQASQLPPHQ